MGFTISFGLVLDPNSRYRSEKSFRKLYGRTAAQKLATHAKGRMRPPPKNPDFQVLGAEAELTSSSIKRAITDQHPGTCKFTQYDWPK